MKLKALVILVSAFAATTAQAERVLVVMKDSNSFNKSHMAYKVKGTNKGGLNLGIKAAVGEMEQSFPKINSMIIDTASEEQIAKLKSNPEIAYVEKEIFHKGPTPVKRGLMGSPLVSGSLGEATPWGIYAVKAPEAWAVNNSQGEGARVLILDTGIDENHPSLKANIEKAKDFSYSSGGYNDDNGHGTHVAGTIAGIQDESGFVGVAPKAKILAGRVCTNEGCSNFAIAAGINWGIQEKVDVISMSLGGAVSTPAERNAILAADKAGIVVVAASGNDGTDVVSFPAALPTVIAVGAIGPDLKKTSFSQYGKELAVVAPGADVMSSVPVGTGRQPDVTVSNGQVDIKVKSTVFVGGKDLTAPVTKEVVPAGLGLPSDFKAVNVKGKFALVQRGEINFVAKVENAIKAGAAGVIVYNNEPGLIQGSLSDDGSELSVPAFMVEEQVGKDLIAEVTAGKTVTATMDLMVTDYSLMDGTSMATPHVSGVVALMRAANKNLNGKQVKEILQATATTLENSRLEVGSGLVNAEAAVEFAIEAAQETEQPKVDLDKAG